MRKIDRRELAFVSIAQRYPVDGFSISSTRILSFFERIDVKLLYISHMEYLECTKCLVNINEVMALKLDQLV